MGTGNRNRTDPASKPQVLFVHSLVKEAINRGHLKPMPSGKTVQAVYDAVVATDPATTWHVLGPEGPMAFCQLSTGSDGYGSGPGVWYASKAASVGDVGRLIDMLLTWMPDKKPKGKPRPKSQTWSNPSATTPQPVAHATATAAPPGASAEQVIAQAVGAGKPVMVIVVPLAHPMGASEIESVTELIGMFLRSRTTVQIDGELTVHWTQDDAHYSGEEGGHVEEVR